MDLQFVLLALGAFIIVVVGLILLHELGHYSVARMFGLVPKVFSVGMGPELFGVHDRKGTRWKFCAIPIGGYVKFAGEMHPGAGTPEQAAEDYNFAALARWKRACIIAAGPIANLLVTAVIFMGLTLYFGKVDIAPVIDQVIAGSTAEAAGIENGDKIVSWDGDKSSNMQNLIRHVRIHPNTTVDLEIKRGDQTIDTKLPIRKAEVTDEFGNVFEVGQIGVIFPQKIVPINGPADLFDATIVETMRLFKMQSISMGQIAIGQRDLSEVSGPLRMIKMSGEQMSLGFVPLLYFAAIISIAIAFMNLLPIPGLDGGYLALYAVESVTRKDTKKKTMEGILKGGYVAIGVLMIFAFSNDIRVMFWN